MSAAAFQLVRLEKTWSDASDHCAALGQQLAVVRSDEAHAALVELVGWLQLSEQLPADKQVVQYSDYPIPCHRRGTASELVQQALDRQKDSKNAENQRISASVREGTLTQYELQAFLRSMPVCAWGECLGLRKNGLKKWQDI